MALVIDGVNLNDGDPLLVGGVQAQRVVVMPDNVEVWRNTAIATAPTLFVASDGLDGIMDFSWVLPTDQGTPTCTYSVRLVSNDAEVATGIVGATTAQRVGDFTSADYYVVAVNVAGETGSNQDAGSSYTGVSSPAVFITSSVLTAGIDFPAGVPLTLNLFPSGGGGGGGSGGEDGKNDRNGQSGNGGAGGAVGVKLAQEVNLANGDAITVTFGVAAAGGAGGPSGEVAGTVGGTGGAVDITGIVTLNAPGAGGGAGGTGWDGIGPGTGGAGDTTLPGYAGNGWGAGGNGGSGGPGGDGDLLNPGDGGPGYTGAVSYYSGLVVTW